MRSAGGGPVVSCPEPRCEGVGPGPTLGPPGYPPEPGQGDGSGAEGHPLEAAGQGAVGAAKGSPAVLGDPLGKALAAGVPKSLNPSGNPPKSA